MDLLRRGGDKERGGGAAEEASEVGGAVGDALASGPVPCYATRQPLPAAGLARLYARRVRPAKQLKPAETSQILPCVSDD